MFKKQVINPKTDEWDESSGLFDDSTNIPQILVLHDNLDISDDWDTPVQQKPSVKPGWIRIAAISGSALAITLLFLLAIKVIPGERKEVLTSSSATKEIFTLNTPENTVPLYTKKPTAITDESILMPAVSETSVVSDPDTLKSPWYMEDMRYYYFQLNEEEKKCFRLLYNGIMDFMEEIDISKTRCTKDELDRVFYVVRTDCPELFQLASHTEYTYRGATILSVRLTYRLQPNEYEKRCQTIRTTVEQIKASVSNLHDDFSIEYAAYSWLINHCNYMIMEDQSTGYADSAICDGIAQCAGYSEAFSLILRTMGVRCIEVCSIPEEMHQWNIVSIGGKWYQCDVTWDDAGEDGNRVFADGQNENLSFLNLPDRLMINHTQDKDGFNRPSCTAIEANYVYQEGIYISALELNTYVIRKINEEIQNRWNRGERRFMILFDGTIDNRDKEIIDQIIWPGEKGFRSWTTDHSCCLFLADY